MNAVKEFYETTIELIELLEKNDQVKREENMIKIEKLLDDREGLMKNIMPPFSHEEKQYGKQLTALNQKVAKLLEGEKEAIQREIMNLKKQKESNIKYTNPYEALATLDGGFYDKRK